MIYNKAITPKIIIKRVAIHEESKYVPQAFRSTVISRLFRRYIYGIKMKKVLLICALFFTSNGTVNAADHEWLSAVPTGIDIAPDGLVVRGTFDTSKIACATGASAIFLSNTDDNFQHKLALALTAKATNGVIQVLISNPGLTTSCTSVSAHGMVPTVSVHYWRLH